MVKILRFLLILVFLGASHSHVAQGFTPDLHTADISLLPAFEDSFETETNWMKFEEIVGGSACYADGIGSVIRSMDVAFDGVYSLRVWANHAGSTKSNHVIAFKEYSNRGQIGIWRYLIHAYIAPETANSGQTGPEFSVQNTREITTGQIRTATAGIQYIANTASSDYGQWNIWREVTPGIAGWHPLTTQTLNAGTWYTLTLETDYSNNVYRSFSVQGDGLDLSMDLSTYHIAQENKSFTEEAFVITVEAENRWNNCGTAGVFDYKVYYDLVRLETNIRNVFLPVALK